MKKILLIYLSILFLGLVGLSSCQETGQEELPTQLSEILKENDPVGYEAKLKELTLFMGEVFKDSEARKELFELAKADEYEEDISYSLKKLLETNQNPNTRRKSAIVNAFYKNAENHRVSQKEDFNEQDLIDFINENNISVLAPYMIGYFTPESLTNLTVSWWTEEMELKGLAQDPDWKGETPGFKLNLDEDGNFIRFRKTDARYMTNEMIYANDSYAMANPTLVFGSFGDDAGLDPGDSGVGGGGIGNNPMFPIQNSARCQDLTNNSIVRLTMPKFRLNSSIRAWPHPDRMTVVVVLGLNPGGSAYSNRPFFEVEVTRGAANDKRWIQSPVSFLVNNWQDRQVDMAFVVFNRRSWSGDQEFKAIVNLKVDELGNTTSTITQELTIGGWNRAEVHADATFNRCGTIIDPFRDKGFGTESHGGKSYGIERLSKFEFIVVPEITL